LRDSLERYGIDVLEIAALANDTVGTMAAGALRDKHCDVGIIFGTGTNACYREKISNIKKLGTRRGKKGHMIINTEWGNFDKLPFNEYDNMLDKSTNNPGKQRMEKIISGMYLGEITRLVINDLIRKKYMFVGKSVKLNKDSFKTRHMSLIESDRSRDLKKVAAYLESQSIHNSNLADRNLFKDICKLVSTRAAKISAAAISAVITWMDPGLKKRHGVAIDGTLYERHPGFGKTIKATLNQIHRDKSKKIKLKRATDGSGVGVAIIAAVASKKR